MKNIYDFNETMKLLGKQCYFSEAVHESNLKKELKEVEAAYTDRDTAKAWGLNQLAFEHCFDLIISIYDLGVIHGIRKEWARRKNKKPRQCANTDRATAVKPTTI